MRAQARRHVASRGRLVTSALGALVVIGLLGPAGVLPDAEAKGLRPKLDTTFGRGDGFVVQALEDSYLSAHRVHRLPDGRLLVIGARSSPRGEQVLAARFTRDGQLDATYAGNGFTAVRTGRHVAAGVRVDDFQSPLLATGVDRSGALTVAQVATPWVPAAAELVAVRFDSRGRLDRRYGQGGVARHVVGPFVLGATYTVPIGGRVFRDGSVLMAAWTVVLPPCGFGVPCAPHTSQVVLVRLTRSGDLDGSFGVGGLAVVPTPEAWTVNAFAADGAGRSVAIGTTNTGGLFAQRYRSDGSPETSYGIASVSLIAPEQIRLDRYATAVAIDRRDRVVIAGTEYTKLDVMQQRSPRLLLVRLRSDGTLDTRFGHGGSAKVPLRNPYDETGLAVTRDRIAVMAGQVVGGKLRSSMVAFDGQGRDPKRSALLPHAPWGPFGLAPGRDSIVVAGSAEGWSGRPSIALYRLRW